MQSINSFAFSILILALVCPVICQNKTVCELECLNDGTLNLATCTCTCLIDFAGNNCGTGNSLSF